MKTVLVAEPKSQRRNFLKKTAVMGTFSVTTAMGTSSGFAAELLSDSTAQQARDCYRLGFKLGERIALQLGGSNHTLQFSYLDSAGPSVDDLRLGMVDGLSAHSKQRAIWSESQSYQVGLLGTARVHNPKTGQTIDVAIPAVVLSHLEMARSNPTSIKAIAATLV